MIHVAIVEDEKVYLRQLQKYLDKYQKEKGRKIEISVFTDGDEIVEDYKGTYDIILMDIQMQFMDGMTAAERIRQLDSDVIIVFITNMTEYAVRGYEVDALDYIVKPLEYFAFSRKMDRAVARVKTKVQNYLSIPTENGMKKLNVNDVLYIEIQDHTLLYHTESECIQAKGRGIMRETEQMMLPYGFFRGNNCYLINLGKVEGIEDSCCMVGSQLLQISRSRKKAFMNALVQHMSGEGR